MANVAVVGAQWGDEGKGKIVDWLSARADVVVRFQGGHNAGHTLVIDGKVYKLSLLPSGIVRKGCIGVIGSGVVVDPFALLAEIDRIAAQGVSVTPETLMIAENASLILPVHSELDAMRETAASGIKIGTTKRGIGPAYEDKAGRRGLRIVDLAHPDTLAEKVENLLVHHNALRRGFGAAEVSADALVAQQHATRPGVDVHRDDVAVSVDVLGEIRGARFWTPPQLGDAVEHRPLEFAQLLLLAVFKLPPSYIGHLSEIA